MNSASLPEEKMDALRGVIEKTRKVQTAALACAGCATALF